MSCGAYIIAGIFKGRAEHILIQERASVTSTTSDASTVAIACYFQEERQIEG